MIDRYHNEPLSCMSAKASQPTEIAIKWNQLYLEDSSYDILKEEVY